MQNFVSRTDENAVSVDSLKDVKGLARDINKDFERLEGKVISLGEGNVSGKVLKDMNRSPEEPFIIVLENGSIEEADVLVFRAMGIITKKGGLLSHLGVLSREINIPYISGIEIEKINDGDKVEMVLNKTGKGFIRRLSFQSENKEGEKNRLN